MVRITIADIADRAGVSTRARERICEQVLSERPYGLLLQVVRLGVHGVAMPVLFADRALLLQVTAPG